MDDDLPFLDDTSLWTVYVVTPGGRKVGYRLATTDRTERQLDVAWGGIKDELRKAGYF